MPYGILPVLSQLASPKGLYDSLQRPGYGKERHMQRRTFLLTSLLPAISLLPALVASATGATEIDPRQTFVLQRDEIEFAPWAGLPPGSGEIAKLYGDIDSQAPILS
jgi:hypothetical protein